MRKTVDQQLPLAPAFVDHPHAHELQTISDILDFLPEILDLVHQDLVRNLKNPETGREGLSAEQVLRILVLKQMRSFSYEQLVFHLADSNTYRNFCRFAFVDKTPCKTALQENIKRLRPETLESINKTLIGYAKDEGIEKGRKVRIDATAVESNIHRPTDSGLLYDTVRVLSRIMHREARERFGIPFANRERRARRRQLGILHAKKAGQLVLYRDLVKVTRKAVGEALRVAELLDKHDLLARRAAKELRHYADLGLKVLSQTERRVIKGEKVPALEKVLSIFEPHTDLIVKDKRETVYGHKVNLTSGASTLILDCVIEEGNPADSTRAVPMIERQKEVYGRVPRQASFDGGYASKANLKAIKRLGVKDVAFKKKRGLEVSKMAKSSWVYRRLTRFRAGIEGGISFLKRCFGLRRVTWRGAESFKSYVWGSVVSVNLLILARHTLG